jgi:hypothetical protein
MEQKDSPGKSSKERSHRENQFPPVHHVWLMQSRLQDNRSSSKTLAALKVLGTPLFFTVYFHAVFFSRVILQAKPDLGISGLRLGRRGY